MNHLIGLIITCAISVLATRVIASPFPEGFDSCGVSLDQIVVTFDKPPSKTSVDYILNAHDLRFIRGGRTGQVLLFETRGGAEAASVVRQIRTSMRHRGVIAVAPLMLGTLGLTPGESRYQYQWHLPKIETDDAWNIQTDADDVLIAILDTGGDLTHEDIQGALWTGGSSDPDTTGIGHGTLVGGIAGAITNGAVLDKENSLGLFHAEESTELA